MTAITIKEIKMGCIRNTLVSSYTGTINFRMMYANRNPTENEAPIIPKKMLNCTRTSRQRFMLLRPRIV